MVTQCVNAFSEIHRVSAQPNPSHFIPAQRVCVCVCVRVCVNAPLYQLLADTFDTLHQNNTDNTEIQTRYTVA